MPVPLPAAGEIAASLLAYFLILFGEKKVLSAVCVHQLW